MQDGPHSNKCNLLPELYILFITKAILDNGRIPVIHITMFLKIHFTHPVR
jgi:hypothetical protein